jgi:hypothetical protein
LVEPHIRELERLLCGLNVKGKHSNLRFVVHLTVALQTHQRAYQVAFKSDVIPIAAPDVAIDLDPYLVDHVVLPDADNLGQKVFVIARVICEI